LIWFDRTSPRQATFYDLAWQGLTQTSHFLRFNLAGINPDKPLL